MQHRGRRAWVGISLASALLLGACSDDGGGDAAPTTAAPPDTSGAPSTTTTTDATMDSTTTTGDTSDPLCDELIEPVEFAFSTTMSQMDELGGTCTATLETGDLVEITWNTSVTDATSFASAGTDLDPIDAEGADEAIGGFDDLGAWVNALVDGEGTFQLGLTPGAGSARAPAQADVDGLVALAEALVS